MPVASSRRRRRPARSYQTQQHWKVAVWKTIGETVKYVADATFKFLIYAVPIIYMQWNNGTKLEDIGVKADRAVANAETAAEKAEESAKAIKEKMG